MKKPLFTYLKDFFAFTRVVGDVSELKGLNKIDVLLQNLIDFKKIPGLSISVFKDNKSLYQKGYGYADIEKQILVNPETSVFRVASVSKPIAATALARIVADGFIDLDASFYTYVPYYPKKKWDFTIRQLASHTAGIRSYKGKEYGLNKPYSIKESIEVFKEDDLLFEPGTSYHYNSFDWVLISLAIQEVSGLSFEKYVEEKVLKPLGLQHILPASPSGVDVLKDATLSLVNFYSKLAFGFKAAIPVNNYYKIAGGGFLATSAAIAKLGQVYLNKETLIDDALLSQFITTETINNKPIYYGLGWQSSQDKSGRVYYGHIGNGVGGYSNFFVYPKQKTVISILVNCTNPNIQKELDEVINEILHLEA
ncbi:beta-lactamase family protein [Cellulophaga sp. HaHaR_3_176]|uniref:serine hydrolase domain-containing protein n=1 Tax=Cellulophaga sp. HaHaR_3_176 TaxID=1942464 RepID=UPI001C1F347A|nr:serine hydrolase domain-containing protein [Cellulophaga sp. HaHaR_3_176]QWX84165.1 beta-lactamase family protein [Cellulophaga sp. HaHaR_3_176]